MKKNVLNTIIIALFLFIMGFGCNKEEPLETDPAKIILGKWELIEMDGKPYDGSSGYEEYLPDSVLRQYEYETGENYYKKYSIDTLLHEYIYVPQDDHYLLFFEYRFDFSNKNNEMNLELLYWRAMHNYFTYKRIE